MVSKQVKLKYLIKEKLIFLSHEIIGAISKFVKQVCPFVCLGIFQPKTALKSTENGYFSLKMFVLYCLV